MATHSSNLAWEIPWMRNLVGCSPWGRRKSRHNLATERQQSMVNEQVAFLFINQSSVSSICFNQHPPPLLPPSFPSQLPTTTTALPNPPPLPGALSVPGLDCTHSTEGATCTQQPALPHYTPQFQGTVQSCLQLNTKEMATHSSLLAWEILWTEQPGRAIVHGVAKSQIWLSN